MAEPESVTRSGRPADPADAPAATPAAWQPPPELQDIADLDFDRERRRGYAEAVYCQSKTPAQLRAIAVALRERGVRTLFTRADADRAAAVLDELPDAIHDVESRLL